MCDCGVRNGTKSCWEKGNHNVACNVTCVPGIENHSSVCKYCSPPPADGGSPGDGFYWIFVVLFGIPCCYCCLMCIRGDNLSRAVPSDFDLIGQKQRRRALLQDQVFEVFIPPDAAFGDQYVFEAPNGGSMPAQFTVTVGSEAMPGQVIKYGMGNAPGSSNKI